MLDLTFLSEEQIFGDNQLDIIKKYGTKSAITDFAILSGGFVYDTIGGKDLKNRTDWWWTRSSDGYKNTQVVSFRDDIGSNREDVNLRCGGVRPAFPYSSIKPILSSRVRENSGIKEVEYGEYPKWVVDNDCSILLEAVFNAGDIKTTGKKYTTDSVMSYDRETPFSPKIHTEYEYNGSKYIRFVGDTNGYEEVLSNGIKVTLDKPYWIKVEPIVWLVDEKADIALSKYIILSGLQFKNKRDYIGDFNRTDIKQFMDRYLAKDIECLVIKDKLTESELYDFDSIFEDAINKMNEINEVEKPKTLSLK